MKKYRAMSTADRKKLDVEASKYLKQASNVHMTGGESPQLNYCRALASRNRDKK